MKIDAETLRARMASHTHEELRAVVAAPNGVYTAEAREAAQRELATRPEAEHVAIAAGERNGFLARIERLPRNVRYAFWISAFIAPAYTLALMIAPFLVRRPPAVREFLAAGGAAFVAVAIVAWAIVIGVVREATYVRLLLIAVVFAFAGYLILENIMTTDVSPFTLLGALLIASIAWSFAFDDDVTSYYQALRERR